MSDRSLVERLQANAMDSLVHGVEHHVHGNRKYDYKYVVLHVFHAVELFLKARLAKHDESLIYKKNGDTIGVDYTIDLLIKKANINYLSIYVEDRDPQKNPGQKQLSGSLKKIKEARNDIEHKDIAVSKDDVKNILGETFEFLDIFVRKELEIELKNELDKLDKIRNHELSNHGVNTNECKAESTYKTLYKSYLFHLRHVKYSEPVYDLFICDNCEEEAVVYPDPMLDLSDRHNRKLAHCFHCLTMHSASECARCNVIYEICANVDISWQENRPQQMQILNNNDQFFEEDGDFDGFCENCSDWIDDQ